MNGSTAVTNIRNLMQTKLLQPVAVAVLLLSCLISRAWNDTGHMTVTELAWRAMSSSERNAVTQLLQQHPHYDELLNKNIPSNADPAEWIFLRASTWPDMVRPPKAAHIQKYHRDVWHYINIPFVAAADQGTIHASDHPPKITNVVERLAVIEADLRSSSLPAADRAVALCWYLHLMGDLHQPLHSVAWFSATFNDADGDKGGNDVAIQPHSAAKKLHSYWDQLLGTGESYTFIDHKADEIKELWPASKLQKEFKHKTYQSWADESYNAAVAFAYLDGNVPHAKWVNGITAAQIPDLDTSYEDNARMIAKRRAAVAGIRLGQKLKSIF